jgi:hypothetical protein
MAGAIVMACRGRLVGVFSQKKLVWETIERLEDSDCIEKHLIMADKRSTARHDVVELSYSKMCNQLKEVGRADIRETCGEDASPIKYALWQTEMNQVLIGE